MADETLQAFQLGASLFDRAQTQKRMMEQFQLQSAESVLQQQGLQLQNKIRDISLADAIGEQKSQVEEFDAFSTLGKQVSDYLNNPKPDAKFPVVPAFKSKQYRIEADRMLNNLEKYSARAELLKARDRAEATSNTLRASTINKAIDAGAWIGFNQDGSPNIDVPKMNAYYEKLGTSKIGQTEAKTTSLLGNIDIKKADLQRLISQGASRDAIDIARLALDKSIKEGRLQLDREDLDLKKTTQEAKTGLEREKFDFSKGLQLEKLALEKVRVDQLGKRADAYVQKILQPAKNGEIKLNAVDDRLVKKAADDIANKQGISDAIGYEIGVLDDPSIDEYVKRASAQNILKILNSAEGKDAVGIEESKRLGQFLEFQLNPVKGLATGRLFGTDLPRFVEQISIKKEELDTRVNEGMNRVNSIYRKYGKDIPAGTSQMPSRGSLMTAPAPQTMRSTNAPAMSQTNSPSMSPANASVSIPSFNTADEARAAGIKSGQRVTIRGQTGTLN
jgi:hypothetical protein